MCKHVRNVNPVCEMEVDSDTEKGSICTTVLYKLTCKQVRNGYHVCEMEVDCDTEKWSICTTVLYKLTCKHIRNVYHVCEMEVDCDAEKGSICTTVLYELTCNMLEMPTMFVKWKLTDAEKGSMSHRGCYASAATYVIVWWRINNNLLGVL